MTYQYLKDSKAQKVLDRYVELYINIFFKSYFNVFLIKN
jgi:hypothetical protein